MLLSIRNSAIAAVAALATAALPVTPAQAWGKNEQNFLKGVLATVAVGAVINQAQKNNTATQYQPAPVYRPVPSYQPVPAYQQDYRQNYRQDYREREHRYRRGDYGQTYAPSYAPSVYSTPAARAFMAYSPAERRSIQRRLLAYGYYRGGIDGSFGPGTYAAITAYAQDERLGRNLDRVDSAFGVYDRLIF